MEAQNTNNTKRNIILIILGVIIAAGLAGAIYIATGPHNVAEAVMPTPLAGPRANYEADGVIVLKTEIEDVADFPDVKIPFKVTTADNRYHIEVFKPGNGGGKAVYETYIVKQGDEWKHYDRGDISTILSGIGAVALFAQTESEELFGQALELPSPISIQLTLDSLETVIEKVAVNKKDNGYDVIAKGEDVYDLLFSTSEDSASLADNLIMQALASSNIVVSYDQNSNPIKLVIDNTHAETTIDAGMLGEYEFNLDMQVLANFSHVGEVSAEDTEVPAALLA